MILYRTLSPYMRFHTAICAGVPVKTVFVPRVFICSRACSMSYFNVAICVPLVLRSITKKFFIVKCLGFDFRNIFGMSLIYTLGPPPWGEAVLCPSVFLFFSVTEHT